MVLDPQDANDNDAFIPEVWAHEGLVILEENMIAANLVHRGFQNEIAKFGDAVNPRRPGTFRIKRKVDGTTLTQQDAYATSVRVPRDQGFYTLFAVNDGEGSKSFQELVDVYLLPAMQTIARGVDRAALIEAADDPVPLVQLLWHTQASFQRQALHPELDNFASAGACL